MNPQIPAPDMLGLPAQPILLQILMAGTLALHWLFVGGTFGASLLVLINTPRSARDSAAAKLCAGVLGFLPFMLSMGMTLGIAPLLFVQVLYGNFFYSSNVLMAFWWLMIIPIMLANTYLFYVARARLAGGKKLGMHGPAIIVALFAVLAAVLVSNTVLSQTPQAWAAAREKGAMSLYMGSYVGPRLTFAIFGLLSAGGIFVALLGKLGLIGDADADAKAVKQGFLLAAVSVLLQIPAGAWLIFSVDGGIRNVLTSHAGFLIGAGALAAEMVVLAGAIVKRTGTFLAAAIATNLVAAAGLAFARDAWRRAAIEPHFNLDQVAVNPQWGPFALFAGVLVVGIIVIAVIIKLARTPNTQKTG